MCSCSLLSSEAIWIFCFHLGGISRSQISAVSVASPRALLPSLLHSVNLLHEAPVYWKLAHLTRSLSHPHRTLILFLVIGFYSVTNSHSDWKTITFALSSTQHFKYISYLFFEIFIHVAMGFEQIYLSILSTLLYPEPFLPLLSPNSIHSFLAHWVSLVLPVLHRYGIIHWSMSSLPAATSLKNWPSLPQQPSDTNSLDTGATLCTSPCAGCFDWLHLVQV